MQISLNAVRVFAVVARHSSIALAARDLGVTPSAVSHQIKKLESQLETPLFQRKNNAIALTDAGRIFLEDARAGIGLIDQAAEKLTRDANELVIRASVSLAVRWLIPALERFKKRCPQARIRVETSHISDIPLTPSIDVAITYRRIGHYGGGGELLIRDLCRPVASPRLLETLGYEGPRDIGKVPAISCTENSWDWQRWANDMQVRMDQIKLTHEFDTDDAALNAAAAGFGAVLSPDLLTDRDQAAGTLVPLSGFEPLELGRYYLLLGPRRDGVVGRFRDWLLSELQG